MDRAFRILTIYNRLLQQKEVNKKSLTFEFNTSPRTIQRDIDDIRNFLHENKSWVSTQSEITYDYISESYKLKQIKSNNEHFMYDILTALYLTTPNISYYFYKYLKSWIIKHHSDNQNMLLKYLSKIDIDENMPAITKTSLVARSLNEKKYLKHNKDLLLPLSMHYHVFSFLLVYQLNGEIYSKDINSLDLSLTNKIFNTQPKDKLRIYATFEMSKNIWLKMRRYYQVHTIEKYDDEYLIITFIMTKTEAIQLCFLYRSNIRIISPPDLRDSVIDELLLLQSTYLKQHIKKTKPLNVSQSKDYSRRI